MEEVGSFGRWVLDPCRLLWLLGCQYRGGYRACRCFYCSRCLSGIFERDSFGVDRLLGHRLDPSHMKRLYISVHTLLLHISPRFHTPPSPYTSSLPQHIAHACIPPRADIPHLDISPHRCHSHTHGSQGKIDQFCILWVRIRHGYIRYR